METIIIQTDPKKSKAIKQFLKAFGVMFETEKSPYAPAFVKKIKARTQNAEAGNTVTIDPNNLWESLGLK
jgi:hypothetical protein